MIRTPDTEGDLLAPDHPMRTIARAIPLGAIGAPEEVAQCALLLASDEASYVTGPAWSLLEIDQDHVPHRPVNR